MDFSVQQYAGVGGIGVVVALVEIIKPWVTESRVYPLAALALGVAWQMLVTWVLKGSYPEAVVWGLLTGIAASGLWGFNKTVIRGA